MISVKDRLKFVIKQMFVHGKNLGSFVCIYKAICCLCRNMGWDGGSESLVAGFIGGFTAFGESKGISGAVNLQIVLYLFSRLNVFNLIFDYYSPIKDPSKVSYRKLYKKKCYPQNT